MKPLNRINSVIHFQECDRPPVIPELIAVTATIAGVSPKEYVRSGSVLAECQLNAQRRIGHDAVFAMADLCVEAEAVGCKLFFPEDNYPYVKSVVIKDFADLSKIDIPDPAKDGRMPEMLKATRMLKEAAGGHLPVIANVVGPITLASRIMDIEKMLYMIVDHPDRFREILTFCRDVSDAFANALIREGADGIIIFDPTASPSVLPEKIFKEFVLPHLRDLFSSMRSANPDIISWYSVAGPIHTNLSILDAVTADISTIDYMVPIETAMRYSYTTVINGNIKPNLFLEGNENAIFKEASALLGKTRTLERFILGSGCEVPLYSKIENISALVKAAEMEARHFESINGGNAGSIEVKILPHRRVIRVPRGSNLLDTIKKAGVKATNYCQMSGSCGKCIVKIKSGYVAPPDRIEKLQLHDLEYKNDSRLACCLNVEEPMEIYVPYQTRLCKHFEAVPAELYEKSIQKRLDHYGFAANITAKRLDLLDFLSSYPETYEKLVSEKFASKKASQKIVDKLYPLVMLKRKMAFSISDNQNSEIIDISISDGIYGLAVDIGTTTISTYLHNLENGELICVGLTENTQSCWGSDVISRVTSVSSDHSLLALMQEKLVDDINNIISYFHDNYSVNTNRIYEMVVVANPIMTHFFLGENPEALAQSPFTPIITGWKSIPASSMEALSKLNVNTACRLQVLPSIDGFVGADAVAGILASGIHENEEISLFVDIGTNGEIAIGNRKRIVCTSVATGPVFEGAHISSGRMFQVGSINSLDIDDDGTINYDTIGGSPPLGLCGSGVIDSAAAFLRRGIIDSRGHFINRDRWPQMKDNFFILVPKHKTATFSPIGISAKDIEEIQKAKAAIRTGIDLLAKSFGVGLEDIQNIFISGSFGICLNMESAKTIGMIPDFPNAEFHFMKNSAGTGARIALLSLNARKNAVKIASFAEHINLANHENFGNAFIDNMLFPTVI